MLSEPFDPTPDHALNVLLEELVLGIQATLKEDFLGAYLGGSFAHGGWDAYSDVDFIVVIEQDLSPAVREELRVVHARIFTREHYWARHLEGSYFPKAILGDLARTDEPVWYLDNGSLNFERSTHDNTLVVRWVLRECGVTLAGPEPADWIPSVPEGMLKTEVRAMLQGWGREVLDDMYALDSRWAQFFTVLSICRMLHTLDVGEVHSKPEGAAWAKEALDLEWADLIDDALSARPNQYDKCYIPSDPHQVERTKAFMRYALNAAQTRWRMRA